MNDSEQDNERWYPRAPIAGVGVVVFKDGKILTIKRGQEPSKGKWSIPGGRIELGETAQEAGRREVKEECSIDVQIERVLDAASNIIRDEEGRIKYHFVIIDLLARYVSGELRAQSDAEECRWVTPGEIAELDLTPLLREMLTRQKLI
ncbi:MAG TPA: NUDIX hydrolase [Dehalococcoidia bacterium]|nr:NUDIX hydrolase [Dehalococcoidia bacterium]